MYSQPWKGRDADGVHVQLPVGIFWYPGLTGVVLDCIHS